MEVLTKEVTCPATVDLEGDSALVIDGFALVAAVGKPEKAKTFGDLSDVFVNTVLSKGTAYKRVDIVFDRYREKSIKASTRTRRSRNVRAIRRIIEDRSVPLPSKWGENKADLARFLSEELIAKAPQHKVVVVSGGFKDEMEVQCTDSTVDVHELRCNHEEADTRIVLHVIHNNGHAENVVVSARDTDVLLLLLAHRERITSKVWFAAGTAKKPKFIPLDHVYRKLPAETEKAIIQFHATTGCDTTSYLFGHSKKTAWAVFKEYFYLLISLGEGTLTTDTLKRVETFVCRIYKTNVPSVYMARFMLFPKAGTPDKLPPTSDALKYHTMRAHYQAMVWRQAHYIVHGRSCSSRKNQVGNLWMVSWCQS